MQKSREILHKVWGYREFRPLQEDIVDAAIYGKDVLALLPTGGGKSVCFQVPGIAREGICIVVSPLIALMEDQVSQLKQRGIRAAALTSGMSYREMDATLDNARFGGLDFLYVSPERVQTDLFRERVKLMELGLIVVDEAHCISEWGHDFRPSYTLISVMREWHPQVPIMALTATATPKVKEDIVALLQLKDPQVIEASFERNNLSYQIYHVENKLSALLSACSQHSGQVGIIYCQTRKSVKAVAKHLAVAKLPVAIYHGGLNQKERSKSMKSWMDEKTPIMIATNAFGMGIDKPNVRFVAHYELPNNPEAYFQEAGRAGRDNAEATTYAFVGKNDLKELEQRIESQFPPIDRVKFIFRSLFNFLKVAIGSGKDESYPLDLAAFAKRYDLNVNEVYVSLKLMEMNGELSFREEGMLGSRVKVAVDNAHLYAFQLRNHDLDALISALCRLYRSIFDEFTEIDEESLALRLKLSPAKLQEQLKKLETNGMIDINWRTSLPTVTMLRERLPDDYLQLRPEVYTFRKEQAIRRMNAMRELVEGSFCRPRYIIEYFGQFGKDCGKCDYCKAKGNNSENLRDAVINLLKTPSSMDELLKQFEISQHQSLKDLLRELLMEERINFSDHRFALNP